MKLFYTIEEAAVTVRRGGGYVRKAIKSGALKASLQGGRYLIIEQDLKAWVKGPSKRDVPEKVPTTAEVVAAVVAGTKPRTTNAPAAE